jgi:hypothetical protein
MKLSLIENQTHRMEDLAGITRSARESALVQESTPVQESSPVQESTPVQESVSQESTLVQVGGAYPTDLTTKIGDAPIAVDDLEGLRGKYGRFMLLLGREPGAQAGSHVAVTGLGLLKFGVIARFAKEVPRARAAEILREAGEDDELFGDRPAVLVCASPLDAQGVRLLAEAALREEQFFEIKLAELETLASQLVEDPLLYSALAEDCARHLEQQRAAFEARVRLVAPPTGEWEVYSRGAGAPTHDRLGLILKAYARRGVHVLPTAEPAPESEARALVRICDRLRALAAKLQTELPPPAHAPVEPLPPGVESEAEFAARLENLTRRYDYRHVLEQRRDAIAAARITARNREVPTPEYDIDNPPEFVVREPAGSRSRAVAEDAIRALSARVDQVLCAALASPAFAGLARDPALFEHVDWPRYGDALLRNLMSAEYTAAAARLGFNAKAEARNRRVTPDEPYVLRLSWVAAMGPPNFPEGGVDAVRRRLDAYVGGYLGDLDLSRTFITGSAIAAAAIETDVERTIEYSAGASEKQRLDRFARYLHVYYPPTRTTFRNGFSRRDYLELVEACFVSAQYVRGHRAAAGAKPKHAYNIFNGAQVMPRLVVTPLVDDAYKLTLSAALAERKGELRVELDIRGGADVDMAVDVETDEEFDETARRHYEAVRAKWPGVLLRKAERPGGHHTWTIVAGRIEDVWRFRPVEIYRANFGHIMTHHVGMVRGAYTAAFGGPADFFVAASLVSSMVHLTTPNYYYFASRKALPQEVIVKYAHRGFSLSSFPQGIRRAISITMGKDPVWGAADVSWGRRGDPPALSARGQFSAFSLWAAAAIPDGRWTSRRRDVVTSRRNYEIAGIPDTVDAGDFRVPDEALPDEALPDEALPDEEK